jgi:hypothetical protein
MVMIAVVPTGALLRDLDESVIITPGNRKRPSQVPVLKFAVVSTSTHLQYLNKPILPIKIIGSSAISRSERVVCCLDSRLFEIVTKPQIIVIVRKP